VQPNECPANMTHKEHRWLRISDFVDNFNRHRANFFHPASNICVDESMSRWYGQGGDWINKGLPMYVAIDRKPENGCEIQTVACGDSGIMLRLKVVKGKDEDDDLPAELDEEDKFLHGTKVMMYLVSPWLGQNRLVCADSYFASVGAARALLRRNTFFIGVIKTASRNYPLKALAKESVTYRGAQKALFACDPTTGSPNMLAGLWVDRERRYFIGTTGSMALGTPYIRERWRQTTDLALNQDAERVCFEIPQPKIAELYYKTCGKVDQHNRDRQDTLGLERKYRVHDWSMRVNHTILAMIFVDTFRAYKLMTIDIEPQKEFYGKLAAELIDNTYDRVGGTRRSMTFEDGTPPALLDGTGRPRSGIAAHLTPTKRFRVTKQGKQLPHKLQGRCIQCKARKTTIECSVCKDDSNCDKPGWLCSSSTGKGCFVDHLRQMHPDHIC
jgi:Transposase IS4